MVRSGTPEPAGGEPTLGDLVSLATRDMSQLIRYEMSLAKAELRGDVRRAAMGGVLFAITAFFGCLMLFSLCFAYAYLLYWAGAPGGMAGSFGFVFLTLLVLALISALVAKIVLGRMTGMKKTRESVTEGIGMLRPGKDGKDSKDDGHDQASGELHKANADGHAVRAPGTGTGKPLPDGRHPEIADHSPR